MNHYVIRSANKNDIPFLADIVIHAEKSNSDRLSYSTLFNIPESKVKELIMAMFDEEVDGCEFSISSFLIAEFEDKPVAGFGAWIENHGNPPSKLLKANLLGFIFGSDFLNNLKATSEIVRDIMIERERGALQLEYLYVDEGHRGKKLGDRLIQDHIRNATKIYPELKKVQVQCFSNNLPAVKVYERCGFTVSKKYNSDNKELLNYLPFFEKILMEKRLN